MTPAPAALLAALLALPASAEYCTDPAGGRFAVAGVVNVNTATREELQQLYRVGPVMADRIIEGRPYAVGADLVSPEGPKGIGPAWWAVNGVYVSTQGPTTLGRKLTKADAPPHAAAWQCSDGRTVRMEP